MLKYLKLYFLDTHMAKFNQWELVDEQVLSETTHILEPYNTWNENFVFWLGQYLSVKCDEQSKRFVKDDEMSKIKSIQEKIAKCTDIEKMADLVNELAIHKFKGIKQYFNNVYPIYYYMLQKKAFSIRNITTKLLVSYFSTTKDKPLYADDRIRKITLSRNCKEIYELSYASKINRLTILINFIKHIEDSNVDKLSENEVFLFNIKRQDIAKHIKKEKRVLSVLTPKDGFQRFFEAIEKVKYKEDIKERNVLMLKILMYLGLRVSELIYLKKDDITIENNKVKFNIIGKGNKQRLLYVTLSHIESHMIKYEKMRKESVEGYYFTTNKGTQINDRYINTIVSSTLLEAGIEVTKKSSVHMLRHSVASYLKHTLKLDNASISKWLGHEDIKTTMIYLHYTEQEIIDMSESFKRIS